MRTLISAVISVKPFPTHQVDLSELGAFCSEFPYHVICWSLARIMQCLDWVSFSATNSKFPRKGLSAYFFSPQHLAWCLVCSRCLLIVLWTKEAMVMLKEEMSVTDDKLLQFCFRPMSRKDKILQCCSGLSKAQKTPPWAPPPWNDTIKMVSLEGA